MHILYLGPGYKNTFAVACGTSTFTYIIQLSWIILQGFALIQATSLCQVRFITVISHEVVHPRLISLVLVQYYRVLYIGPNPIQTQCGPVSGSGKTSVNGSAGLVSHMSAIVLILADNKIMYQTGRAGQWLYSEPETDYENISL